MSRAFTPKVVTANDLLEGDTIWLTENDQWTRHMAEAELIDDEAHAQIRLLFAEGQHADAIRRDQAKRLERLLLQACGRGVLDRHLIGLCQCGRVLFEARATREQANGTDCGEGERLRNTVLDHHGSPTGTGR